MQKSCKEAVKEIEIASMADLWLHPPRSLNSIRLWERAKNIKIKHTEPLGAALLFCILGCQTVNRHTLDLQMRFQMSQEAEHAKETVWLSSF